jgi:integrase
MVTFKECADRYIAANRAGWKNEKHADQWFATFNETKRGSLKFPAATEAINALPVSAIDTGLVLKVLEPIWTKTPESASRIRGRVEAVLDWAKVRGYRDGENPASWRGHLKDALPQRSRDKIGNHHDAVPYGDMPTFMAGLRGKDSVSARALELTILTATRTGEAIGAKWGEIDLGRALARKSSRNSVIILSDSVVWLPERCVREPGRRAQTGPEGRRRYCRSVSSNPKTAKLSLRFGHSPGGCPFVSDRLSLRFGHWRSSFRTGVYHRLGQATAT